MIKKMVKEKWFSPMDSILLAHSLMIWLMDQESSIPKMELLLKEYGVKINLYNFKIKMKNKKNDQNISYK